VLRAEIFCMLGFVGFAAADLDLAVCFRSKSPSAAGAAERSFRRSASFVLMAAITLLATSLTSLFIMLNIWGSMVTMVLQQPGLKRLLKSQLRRDSIGLPSSYADLDSSCFHSSVT